VRDEAAVITEPFKQWVIEDRFAGPRPRWEDCGVQFAADVRPFEAAKLRMLNGAHSGLAYLGLARGHAFVHEAVADPEIAPLIDRLMLQEAATSLAAAPGQDLAAYADALTARFANPALAHRLAQIAMDGSQKIPQRWLDTLAFHHSAGRSCPAILTALAAWVVHVRGDERAVEDPRVDELAALWRAAGRTGIIAALFGPVGVFARHWVATPDDAAFLRARMGTE
jgi:fructuronate reductase